MVLEPINVVLLKWPPQLNRLTIRKPGIWIRCLKLNKKMCIFFLSISFSNSILSFINLINLFHQNYLILQKNGVYIKVMITSSRFVEMKFHPLPAGGDFTLRLHGKINFYCSTAGQVSIWYLLTKLHIFPLILKCSQNDEILWRLCLPFSFRLTSYASQKYSRNNYHLLKCTSMDFMC